MNRILSLALVLTISMLSPGSAHAASVKYDYDKTVDFSDWKTMAWKRPEPPGGSSLSESRIHRTLEEGFAAKGYTEAERNKADFLIDFHAAAHRELRIDEGWGPRFNRDLRVDAYPVGVLIVDVFDRQTGRLAWLRIGRPGERPCKGR